MTTLILPDEVRETIEGLRANIDALAQENATLRQRATEAEARAERFQSAAVQTLGVMIDFARFAADSGWAHVAKELHRTIDKSSAAKWLAEHDASIRAEARRAALEEAARLCDFSADDANGCAAALSSDDEDRKVWRLVEERHREDARDIRALASGGERGTADDELWGVGRHKVATAVREFLAPTPAPTTEGLPDDYCACVSDLPCVPCQRRAEAMPAPTTEGLGEVAPDSERCDTPGCVNPRIHAVPSRCYGVRAAPKAPEAPVCTKASCRDPDHNNLADPLDAMGNPQTWDDHETHADPSGGDR